MDHSADFRIRWEWEPSQSVRAPEYQATWARINLFIDEDCVTLVEDRASGSSRRSIFAPLYPLAEWIVYNWWFLLAHSRPARPGGGHWDRHCVRAAGDGFIWPNLEIIPEGRRTRVLWDRDVGFEKFAFIRYLTSGEATVDSDVMRQTLTHVVTSVLERLREQEVPGTPLEKEWESLEVLDIQEQQFCIAAARLGLDPFAEADRYESAIIGAAEQLPRSLLRDFFDAVHADRILPAVDWLTAATAQASTVAGGASDEIRELRQVLKTPGASTESLPYKIGWKHARVVREALGLAPEHRLDVHKYASELYLSGADSSLQAVGVAPSDARPAVVLGRSLGLNGTRFILGRALWHRLAADEPSFLITTAYTERQKIERAFAAELLAPAVGIEAELDVLPEEAVQEDLGIVAEHFGVSAILVEHQIDNQILVRNRT